MCDNKSEVNALHLEVSCPFHNSVITKSVVCACIMVEMDTHLMNRVPVQSQLISRPQERSQKVIV